MAFDLGKLKKFAPLVGVYAFYNVFATNYPTDPIAGMRTAITNFMANPIANLQAKMTNITNLAIVVVGVPLVMNLVKPPVIVKQVVSLATYYFIGDQTAAVLNGAGRFGATSGYILPGPARTWGGETSAVHQRTAPAGMVKNIYGG